MNHTTQILLTCYIAAFFHSVVDRENKHIKTNYTHAYQGNQIKPRQLHLNSSGDEISIPNSPLTSCSFKEDCIISATSRKASTFFLPISSKKRKFVKTEDDTIPLPDPFPLPKRYRADVEVALASGKMTKETMSAFLKVSAVAAAMLVYKHYPTREDFLCCQKCGTKV